MLSKKELNNALLRGALKAACTYSEWTEDATIHDSGVEMFVSVEIARELIASAKQKNERHYVWLEAPFWDVAIHCKQTERRGQTPKEFQGNPRVDIVYFNRRRPVAVIEVKRFLSFNNIKGDIDRISSLLRHLGGTKGKLGYELVLGVRPLTSWDRKEPDDIMLDIIDRVKKHPSSQSLNVLGEHKRKRLSKPVKYEQEGRKPYKVEGFWAGAFCFSLNRRST